LPDQGGNCDKIAALRDSALGSLAAPGAKIAMPRRRDRIFSPTPVFFEEQPHAK